MRAGRAVRAAQCVGRALRARRPPPCFLPGGDGGAARVFRQPAARPQPLPIPSHSPPLYLICAPWGRRPAAWFGASSYSSGLVLDSANYTFAVHRGLSYDATVGVRSMSEPPPPSALCAPNPPPPRALPPPVCPVLLAAEQRARPSPLVRQLSCGLPRCSPLAAACFLAAAPRGPDEPPPCSPPTFGTLSLSLPFAKPTPRPQGSCRTTSRPPAPPSSGSPRSPGGATRCSRPPRATRSARASAPSTASRGSTLRSASTTATSNITATAVSLMRQRGERERGREGLCARCAYSLQLRRPAGEPACCVLSRQFLLPLSLHAHCVLRALPPLPDALCAWLSPPNARRCRRRRHPLLRGDRQRDRRRGRALLGVARGDGGGARQHQLPGGRRRVRAPSHALGNGAAKQAGPALRSALLAMQ